MEIFSSRHRIRIRFFLLFLLQTEDDCSIVIEDSDGEADAVETTEECYEIIVPDDYDAAATVRSNGVAEMSVTHRTVLVTASQPETLNQPVVTNYSVEEALDEDGDKAFGMLIVEELRKMTPSEQQQFKRNVTQLMYS